MLRVTSPAPGLILSRAEISEIKSIAGSRSSGPSRSQSGEISRSASTCARESESKYPGGVVKIVNFSSTAWSSVWPLNTV
jgi:hypothetical protein